jgi:seryl-tRNA synthetase
MAPVTFMIDLKLIRKDKDAVKKGLARKGVETAEVDALLELDAQRRSLLQEVEALKAERNKANDEISKAKRAGELPDEIIGHMKTVSHKITYIDGKVADIDAKSAIITVNIPNLPHISVPDGSPPASNEVVREWGEKPFFKFKPKNHVEIASALEWMSLSRAVKVTGSGFALFEGDGARLVRGLINFMLDVHTKKAGYVEIWPPLLVNRKSMMGTGQLPTLEGDMYRLKDEDYYLIPTGEVPVSNMHRDEVIDDNKLPLKYASYTPCFRREAGSYGKDTRGLSRVHQFDKVELVKFVKPEQSLNELEALVKDAEKILQLLEIPYRVVLLCAKDLSFAGAKCYDLEAYAPGMDRWFEVSSCSAFFDFQARRMNVKFKVAGSGKSQYVHTLNGSGVALARTIICLLETHQQADGTLKIPKALAPYM